MQDGDRDENQNQAGTDETGGRMATRDGGMVDFLMAFSLGALFGAGLALALAPQSGEKTRKELEKKSRKWRKQAGKRLEETGETLRGTGGEILEDAEELVGDWSDEISEAVERGIRSIRSAVEDEIGRVEKRLHKKKKGLFR